MLDAGAARDEALGTRSWGWQLNSKRNLALVAQKAELHGPVLIVALCGEFFAKRPDGANALAVQRSDDITRFHAGLFRGRTGVVVAHEYSFAIGSAKKRAELDAAARRNLMDHAAKLRRAFDALSVDFRHHVVFLEACLGRGTVRNNFPQDYAALGSKL